MATKRDGQVRTNCIGGVELDMSLANIIAPQDPPKSRRRGVSKVKTGCLTCKIRRVKCDEGKPFCHRCIKFRIKCDGYPHLVQEPEARGKRIILPETFRSTIYALNSALSFGDEKEHMCFRLYCDEIARQIKGPFPTSLWDRLIPQRCETEPALRYAVISIGAICKVIHDAKKSKNQVKTLAEVAGYAYALEQHGKALWAMKSMLSNAGCTNSKLLIACVLVFCFETLSARQGTAAANATSGLRALAQIMQSRNSQDGEYLLGNSSDPIVEELATAMAGLDVQVMTFMDTRTEACHIFMIESANRSIKQMPDHFTTLKTARNFWFLIMRRNFHFLRIAVVRGHAHDSTGNRKTGTVATGPEGVIGRGGTLFSTVPKPDMSLRPESLAYRDDITQWSAACADLFDQVAKQDNKEEKILVALLRMHSIVNHVCLAGAFFHTETEYDVFLPEFRQILTLLEYTQPYLTSKGSSSYQIDLGIVFVQFYVGVRCRDRVVRDRIHDMMTSTSYREGVWDTQAAAMFVTAMRDAEEPERDESGYIPDHKRFYVAFTTVNLEEKKVIIGLERRGLTGLEYVEHAYRFR